METQKSCIVLTSKLLYKMYNSIYLYLDFIEFFLLGKK